MNVVPHALDAKRCIELVAQYDAQMRAGSESTVPSSDPASQRGLATPVQDASQADGATTEQRTRTSPSGTPAASDGTCEASVSSGSSSPPPSSLSSSSKRHDRWVSGSNSKTDPAPEVAEVRAALREQEASKAFETKQKDT